jgi:cytochrome c peroxidase
MFLRFPVTAALSLVITVLTVPAGAAGLSRAEVYAQAAAMKALGEKIFFDTGLSASSMMSCASCHDTAHAFSPPNAAAVQSGGPDMMSPGTRAVPMLTYRQTTPHFTEHYFESEEEGDESVDAGPTGGLGWDGRFDRGREQAKVPLLAAHEMANGTAEGFAQRLAKRPYAAEFRKVFGKAVFEDAERALAAAGRALEAFEEDPARFYPYSSKYDAYLTGRAKLTDQEAKGLELFTAEDKGNCNSCHRSEVAGDGTPPQFTDYGLIALAVPRNMEIPANADPAHFDLGLCGPDRADFATRADYCGRFKAPSLRNVTLKQSFFHNGVFHDLRDVVAFYAERDTDPAKWYGPSGEYNDLPAEYAENVNQDPPFGRKKGGKPALNADEIDAIVAFLKTLTDGYRGE